MGLNTQIADLQQAIIKQNERIEESRDVMLWRTKEFKAMIVSTEIANAKAKALESHLSKYILQGDEADEIATKVHDRKIEKLEEHILLLKLACAEKDARIAELESLEVFNTEEDEEDEEGYEYDEERGCEDCHTIPQPGGCACGRYEK